MSFFNVTLLLASLPMSELFYFSALMGWSTFSFPLWLDDKSEIAPFYHYRKYNNR
jgi:hypothetical protein